jgi:hypothetical protein|nr:MAG TPA: hypothetical protein [Herelleviridae sp.]
MSNNCLQLKSPRFSRYINFAYIDTTGYLADRIFIENKVRVKFCGDYKHREKNYVVVICKIKKKDVSVFLQSMAELKNRAILMENTDYESFCKEQFEKFISDIQKKH